VSPRITLVISSLGTGGAERVLAGMCNYWAEAGLDITLVTLRTDIPDHYAVDPRVQRVEEDLFWTSHNVFTRLRDMWSRIRQLRSTILQTRPDVVISFIDKNNIRVLLSLWSSGVPVIVSERSVPQMEQLALAWRLLRRITYPRAAAVVAQTAMVKSWLEAAVHPRMVRVIPNAVAAQPLNPDRVHSRRVVAMGRLSSEKRFDLLLRGWAELEAKEGKEKKEGWQLSIVGDGELRCALQSEAERLGVSASVTFHGNLEDPTEVLGDAAFFVLTSAYEGFPNALLEAMACGLPAISFDCPGGPADIIRDGVDGLLIADGDVAELARSMQLLMDDAAQREALSQRASEVIQRFSQQAVMQLWNDLITQVEVG